MAVKVFTEAGWMEFLCPVVLRRSGNRHPSSLDDEELAAFQAKGGGGGHRSWKLVYSVEAFRNILDDPHALDCPCGKRMVLIDEEVA